MQTVKELRARAKELGIAIPKGSDKEAIAVLVAEESQRRAAAIREDNRRDLARAVTGDADSDISGIVASASVASREARRAEAREGAGVKWAGYSRQTGALIQVVRVADSTVEADQPWASICCDHGTVQGWSSYSKADHATAIPVEWCTGCAEA